MIVDDHPVVREGFARFIDTEPGMRVSGQFAAASEALSAFHQARPDVALVDLTLADGSGIELISDILACDKSARILVISSHDEEIYAERCLRAGAMGYLNKYEAAERIIVAIRCIVGGNLYLSDPLSKRLLRKVTGSKLPQNIPPMESLSNREIEVFDLLGKGQSISEIAEHLHLSPKTIETYRAHLKDKLSVDSSSQLARLAYQWVEDGG